MFGAHLLHLERHRSGPGEALDGPRLRAARAPAATGTADEQRAVLALAHRHHAGAEALLEGETRALIVAVHLLAEAAHHGAVRLVADEQLLLERAELAARQVTGDAAGRLAHLAVGEADHRRDEFLDALRLGHDAAVGLRHQRRLAEVLRLRLL